MAPQAPLPAILISDYTLTPPITTSYHLHSASDTSDKDNTIDFGATYKLIKSLLTHPPCVHRHDPTTWPCLSCETSFTHKYWDCAARLLDYFSDFFAADTALMQSLWFYLFDIWQESAQWLPFSAVLDDVDERVNNMTDAVNVAAAANTSDAASISRQVVDIATLVWGAEKARAFEKHVRDTLHLIDIAVWGRAPSASQQRDTREHVLVDPSGEAWCPVGDYETGPWISGVKPWSQFLGVGGPGVVEPVFAEKAVVVVVVKDTGIGTAPPIKRYIPHAGIALLQTHTQRTRALASTLYSSLDAALAPSLLQAFDTHSIAFPDRSAPKRTTTSSMAPLRTLSYALSNGAPPVLRHAGYADVDMVTAEPDWNMLDESVAMCRGWAAYEGVSGSDDGADDDDDGEGEREVVFDLWTVLETKREAGEREKQQQEDEGRGTSETKYKAKLHLGHLFSAWCGIEEC